MSDVRLRVLVSGLLYRATMRAFAAKLAERALPPPRPEEKMALHQAVEERAWALPESAVAAAEGREVDDGVEGLPELSRAADALAEDAVAARAAQ